MDNLIKDEGYKENKEQNQTSLLQDDKTTGKPGIITKKTNKKNTNKILKAGDICGKCETAVIKQIPKKKKLKEGQKFYYEYFFHCPGCKTNYMIPEGKREI